MAEKYPSMEYSVTLQNGAWYGYWGTYANTESARRYQARWGSDTVSYFENFDSYSAAREFVRGKHDDDKSQTAVLCNIWQPEAPEQDAVEIGAISLLSDRIRDTAHAYSEFLPARCYEFLIFTPEQGAIKVQGFIIDKGTAWAQQKDFDPSMTPASDSAWVALDENTPFPRLDHGNLGGNMDIRTIRNRVEKMFQNNERARAEQRRRQLARAQNA